MSKNKSGPSGIRVWGSLLIEAVSSSVRAAWPKMRLGLVWLAGLSLMAALAYGFVACAPWLGTFSGEAPKIEMVATSSATPKQWKLFAKQADLDCLDEALRGVGTGGLIWLDAGCEEKALRRSASLGSSYVARSPWSLEGLREQQQQREEQRERAREDELGRLVARALLRGEPIEKAAKGALAKLRRQEREEKSSPLSAQEELLKKQMAMIDTMRQVIAKQEGERTRRAQEEADAAQAVGMALISKREVEVPKAVLRKAMEPVALAQPDWAVSDYGRAARSQKMVNEMGSRGAVVIAYGLLLAVALLLFCLAGIPWIKKTKAKIDAAALARRESMLPQWESEQLQEQTPHAASKKTSARL